MAKKFAQGRYNMKHPEKYLGNKNPLYRSSWEFAFMKFCDENPNVAKWASESIRIPYKNPLTGRHTIYVPDFFIAYSDKKGKQRAELIEVKPERFTKPPSPQKRKTRKHLQEIAQYGVNEAKWKSAQDFCKAQGMEFKIVTEKELGI